MFKRKTATATAMIASFCALMFCSGTGYSLTLQELCTKPELSVTSAICAKGVLTGDKLTALTCTQGKPLQYSGAAKYVTKIQLFDSGKYPKFPQYSAYVPGPEGEYCYDFSDGIKKKTTSPFQNKKLSAANGKVITTYKWPVRDRYESATCPSWTKAYSLYDLDPSLPVEPRACVNDVACMDYWEQVDPEVYTTDPDVDTCAEIGDIAAGFFEFGLRVLVDTDWWWSDMRATVHWGKPIDMKPYVLAPPVYTYTGPAVNNRCWLPGNAGKTCSVSGFYGNYVCPKVVYQ